MTAVLAHPRTWIYFVQCGPADGPIKIGRAANPARRLQELRVAHWEPLRLVEVLRAHPDDETDLHRCFADGRISGEWFDASSDLLEMVDSFADLHAHELAAMRAGDPR